MAAFVVSAGRWSALSIAAASAFGSSRSSRVSTPSKGVGRRSSRSPLPFPAWEISVRSMIASRMSMRAKGSSSVNARSLHQVGALSPSSARSSASTWRNIASVRSIRSSYVAYAM